MFADFIRALLQAIFGALLLPFRLLGLGEGEPTADDIAMEAVDAARADPLPIRPELTLGQNLRVHAWDIVEGYDPVRPPRTPLPPEAAAWLSRQSKEIVLQLANLRPAELEVRFKTELAAGRTPAGLRDDALERAGLALLNRRRGVRQSADLDIGGLLQLA